MKVVTRILGMLAVSAVIAVILPAGYYLIDRIFLHATASDAGQSFLIGFGLFFVVTLGQMTYAALKKSA